MKAFILDANVVLRFLLADDPQQSPKTKALFALAEAGGVQLRLSHVAVAEIVWVLSTFYDFARADVGAKVRSLLLHKGVESDEQAVILNALDRFARVNADFEVTFPS
jgi:predicted nucleic-acid-binding protein